jgi:transcriptional regulator with XRE-family HTH domain
MRADGPRIAALRQRRGMTQDKLAHEAGLSLRTVQRIEAGRPAALETLNQIAPCLGVVAADIMAGPRVTADEEPGILLKPERSGMRLVERIVAADRLDFGVAFEPRRKSVEAALPLLRRLEELNPYSHGHIRDYDWEVVDTAAARVAAAADLNEAMDALAAVRPEGLRLFTGQYGVMGRKLRWDNEEGHWYTGTRQREEPLSVVAVRVAPASMPSLRIPLLGEPAPEHADADGLLDVNGLPF